MTDTQKIYRQPLKSWNVRRRVLLVMTGRQSPVLRLDAKLPEATGVDTEIVCPYAGYISCSFSRMQCSLTGDQGTK